MTIKEQIRVENNNLDTLQEKLNILQDDSPIDILMDRFIREMAFYLQVDKSVLLQPWVSTGEPREVMVDVIR